VLWVAPSAQHVRKARHLPTTWTPAVAGAGDRLPNYGERLAADPYLPIQVIEPAY
jgi:hypothetical protein